MEYLPLKILGMFERVRNLGDHRGICSSWRYVIKVIIIHDTVGCETSNLYAISHSKRPTLKGMRIHLMDIATTFVRFNPCFTSVTPVIKLVNRWPQKLKAGHQSD